MNKFYFKTGLKFPLSRIRFAASFFLISFMILCSADLAAQNDLKVLTGWPYFKNSQDALYNHLTSKAYDLLEKRSNEIRKLQTLSDWQKRQEFIRKTLLDIIGPFPEKTPLNAQIVRTVKKEGFRVEHIIFESRPGFKVTSSLFIPDKLRKNEKAPVVIYCSGHSGSAYRSAPYQYVILNLVKKGFIVFGFDPVGQGERLGYFDPKTGKPTLGSTQEHSYPGSQAYITGSSQANIMIWDGIRAVDYLLTRKEVDPARIGITGRSGGGTQSAHIAAMDERIYAAAPENYLTNYTRLLQSRGPQDGEQNFYHGIFRGFDHPDFLIVRAPKPALMILTANDMFNIQGGRDTYTEVSAIYSSYGQSEKLGVTEDIAPHASTKKNREAMYVFFQKNLNNPGNPMDEEVTNLTNDELRVTETGQLSTSGGSETVYSLCRAEAVKLHSKLQNERTNLSSWLPRAVASAKKLSGYERPTEPSKPVLTGMDQKEGFRIEKYYIMGEGDYPVPYLLYIPEKLNNKAVIYLHPSGKSADSLSLIQMNRLIKDGFIVLAPDLLGTGETYPVDFRGDAYIQGVSFNLWYASILIGRSFVGIRAGDVERLTGILERDSRITEISAIATGNMSPLLLHAAAFNSAIKRIALIEPLSSYRSIAMTRLYSADYIHNSVPWALLSYDLPDLAASLAPRKLLLANATDADGKQTDNEVIREDISIIKKGYETQKAGNNLQVLKGDVSKDVIEFFK